MGASKLPNYKSGSGMVVEAAKQTESNMYGGHTKYQEVINGWPDFCGIETFQREIPLGPTKHLVKKGLNFGLA